MRRWWIYSIFFFSSRRRHTRSLCDWSSDVCSSDLVAGGSRIGGLRWVRSQVKAQSEESDKHRLPESHHLHVAQQGQMVQVVRFLERNRAAQHIGLEAHIRVCEQKPVARRSFVGFLESMRLA